MSTATTNQVAKESFESKDSKLSVLGFFMAYITRETYL